MGNTLKLEEILDTWDKDAIPDKTDLGNAALGIDKLQSKWLRIRVIEKLKLHKLEAELKELRLEKYEFYSQGPSKETKDKGWKVPSRGMIMKADMPTYMDADAELITKNLECAYQREKCDAVDLILKTISARNWNIRAALDDLKFKSGG